MDTSDKAPTWAEKLNGLVSNPYEMEKIRESCIFSTISHGVMGFGFGAFLGLFLSSFSSASPEFGLGSTNIIDAKGNDVKIPIRQQLKSVFTDMGLKSWRSAKSFAGIAALFSASECLIEGYRAKHDIWNTLFAGCSSGGLLSIKCNFDLL